MAKINDFEILFVQRNWPPAPSVKYETHEEQQPPSRHMLLTTVPSNLSHEKRYFGNYKIIMYTNVKYITCISLIYNLERV